MSPRDDEHEQQGGVKVVDKRRFESDGSTKTDSTQNQEQPKNESAQPKPREERALPPSTDFSSFIVGLATQALMMLGEVPDPETRRPLVNIDGARQTIDLLALLEEKTRGNLTADEDKLLGEILASLRMAFVAKLRG